MREEAVQKMIEQEGVFANEEGVREETERTTCSGVWETQLMLSSRESLDLNSPLRESRRSSPLPLVDNMH